MDSSPYLVQALQQMQGQQPAQTPPGLSLGQMQQIADKRKAFEAANPGQSYMGHGMMQLGQDVMNMPSTLMQAGRNIAAVPGQIGSGFSNLLSKIPGLTAQPMQYGGVPTPTNLG